LQEIAGKLGRRSAIPGSQKAYRLSSWQTYIFTPFAKIVVALYNGVCKNPKRLLSSVSPTGGMVRKFDDWWKTVPADLKAKARKGDEANKPLLNQVNYVLLHLHLQGKHDAKPSHEELKDWLHSGQVDVLRMNK
jgi:hypothetical protein